MDKAHQIRGRFDLRKRPRNTLRLSLLAAASIWSTLPTGHLLFKVEGNLHKFEIAGDQMLAVERGTGRRHQPPCAVRRATWSL